ncbi:translation factor GTPase family protein [Microlunatus ginsengisoli]|uniref:TetM/TetW/TetO/TetS family tetracycline resistance ribosomal protection protein n=1 Tax=Microlunatus ginsengisoli TaxID=363863 RepID=A0ABP7A5Y3_9ACTN
MAFLNLGILAHVDAGKTSLTERLLHAAGVIDEIGSVDAGSTQTDTGELERRRGITITSAVASFGAGGHTINLIDTPGHPDFIAEVERALGVLDGAVLVVSAVEGVQAHTRLLMRTLRRLGVPTVIFVNKIDRAGARPDPLVRELEDILGVAVVALQGVVGAGSRAATVVDLAPNEWLDVLSRYDDALLVRYVERGAVPEQTVRARLRRMSRTGRVHPVLFGSAITGAGVDRLLDALPQLLPTAPDSAAGTLSAQVFKLARPNGVRRTYVRVFGGTLQVRTTVPTAGGERKITGLDGFAGSAPRSLDRLTAGQIGLVRGLTGARIGDWVGAPGDNADIGLPPPSWETVVRTLEPGREGELFAALTELADADPLIMVRRDPERHEIGVSLYGEVQKEVIQATLDGQFGLPVGFTETTTRHVERLSGIGAAAEFIHTAANPFLATVGLRIEPAPVGAGVSFELEVERGLMPAAFFTAVEDTARSSLEEGLAGWAVPDARVIMTASGYAPRQSHAHARFDKSMSSTGSDFRFLTALVTAEALRAAGTVVCEPIHAYRVEAPADRLPAVLELLGRVGTSAAPVVDGPLAVITGELPAARMSSLVRRLAGMTRGEGLLESRFVRYDPVRDGEPPHRPRSRPDALQRRNYLLATAGRAPG